MKKGSDCLNMNKKKFVFIIFLVLTVAWCFYIWSFSLKDAMASNADSEKVVKIVNKVLKDITGKRRHVSAYLVRKLGHFSEFSVLGILLFCTLKSSKLKKMSKCCIVGILSGAAVALSDEFLQSFSDGRSPQITDALIDLSGVIFGFSLAMLVLFAYFKIFKKTQKHF